MPITSKVSVKSQTVLPQAVREHLGIAPGDEVEYELREGCVVVRRRRSAAPEDPFILFTEWSGDADKAAYDDL